MDYLYAYLIPGIVLFVFIHIFYEWIPGISIRQKLLGTIYTIFLWPIVLVTMIIEEISG